MRLSSSYNLYADGYLFNKDQLPRLPSSNNVYNEMNRLADKYPFVQLSEFGKSVMGRPLHYICVGNGTRRVFYSASHHANEWISTLILLKFMNALFKSYETDTYIYKYKTKDLLCDTSLCFAPLINPDGVDLVLGTLPKNKYYECASKIAEYYPTIPFPTGWKANIRGTDLNLQYPANWEKAKKIKYEKNFTGPSPRDYVGPCPLSEPESLALAQLTCHLSPDTIIALHTQGKEIYWKFSDCEPAGAYDLGLKLSKVSGYALSETPPISDNAGYKDWFIQKFNRPGYTIEMGSGESPLPLDQFDSIYADMEPLLSTAAAGY